MPAGNHAAVRSEIIPACFPVIADQLPFILGILPVRFPVFPAVPALAPLRGIASGSVYSAAYPRSIAAAGCFNGSPADRDIASGSSVSAAYPRSIAAGCRYGSPADRDIASGSAGSCGTAAAYPRSIAAAAVCRQAAASCNGQFSYPLDISVFL